MSRHTLTGPLGRQVARTAMEGAIIREMADEMDLNEWETGFVASVVQRMTGDYVRSPSEKQVACLERMGISMDEVADERRARQNALEERRREQRRAHREWQVQNGRGY